jgi:hypothetical protein
MATKKQDRIDQTPVKPTNFPRFKREVHVFVPVVNGQPSNSAAMPCNAAFIKVTITSPIEYANIAQFATYQINDNS